VAQFCENSKFNLVTQDVTIIYETKQSTVYTKETQRKKLNSIINLTSFLTNGTRA
jgi:hypothetical protein